MEEAEEVTEGIGQRSCKNSETAGKPASVYQSLNKGYCSSFNNRKRKYMYAALKAMDLDEGHEEETKRTFNLNELEDAGDDQSAGTAVMSSNNLINKSCVLFKEQ